MTNQMPVTSRRSLLKLAGSFGAAAAFTAGLAACGAPSDSTSPTAAPGTTDAGASSAPASSAAADGAITAAISYELGTNGYDPMTTTAALTVAANWHTMEGLTEIHPATREVFAALGKDLPTQVDDTTWEVALRDGAVFHDGTPVTADDVVFSFQRVLDPANKSLYASFIPFIDSVAKKDDTTVTFTLKYPFSLVAERLSVVKIVPKALVEADQKAFDLAPVGTGPYKLVDNGAGSQKITFERNDAYTGPQPARAATMEWQIIPDDSTRTNALTSDTVQAIDSVPVANLATLAETKSVAAEQGFGLVFVMFNTGSAPMDDVRNRQAVMYALDYEKICSVGMSDLATPATCFVHEDHPAYKAAKVQYPGNQAKAKELLAQTGLTQVRLLASDHGFFANVRPMIKESLEAAGLTVAYEEKKSSDVYATIDSNPDAFDIVVAPGDPSVFGDDADLLLRWWYAGETWTDARMHWKGQESHTKVQELLDTASQATGDEQKAAWHETFDVISENVPLYPIFHRKTPTAFDPETLQDFQPIAVTGLSFVGVGSTK
ncbi:ABC transporter substrate-binding protein [Tessaracoccus lapidicaptus]|uniref:ABC transporter substrate-binding protein n=1 Tax=Tessaracoccus lapidicaptus TaxID=1427523 RepID=A0A1C0ARG2_9ACTN|nr:MULTISPECIES: ABC transporter substrate-binding protein [Tessaracoccus]AQX16197.1 ABC transporter substrate-binding protein [Tessaracoccus sp. T2.5-30]OCL36931.1 ABC transporter substrate-binding protein [Tessaracoccus lapidicaptus]VEP40775.1 Periplasmic dipeptide transport protein [Tessaracoccus lapidicaptus]